jgi:anti-sigma factor RsiW
MSDTKNQTEAPEITCEQCRELLSDYVDREISPAEKASVEKHLSTCTKCSTESTRMAGLKNIVRHWDGVTSSGQFRSKVVQQMIRESQQMPSDQINAAVKAGNALDPALDDDPDSQKTLPPAWILLVALFLAVAAYLVVSHLRQ